MLYKQRLTFLLLVLYMFAATPVQLWHHHSYKYSKLFPLKSEASVKENCKICSHSYAPYFSDINIDDVKAPVVYNNFIPGLMPGYQAFFRSNLVNKGPPRLCNLYITYV